MVNIKRTPGETPEYYFGEFRWHVGGFVHIVTHEAASFRLHFIATGHWPDVEIAESWFPHDRISALNYLAAKFPTELLVWKAMVRLGLTGL